MDACLVRKRGSAGYIARDKFNVIKSSNDMTQDKKDKRWIQSSLSRSIKINLH